LLQAFSDIDEVVRSVIASALDDIREKGAVEALIDARGDEDWSVCRSAALALGKIGDDRAVGPLMLLEEDENLGGQYDAAFAIRMIVGEDDNGCSSGYCWIRVREFR